MNLKPLFDKQRELDARIVKEKGLEGQDLFPNTILASLVELAECANEWRGFKHWSEDQEPRTESDEGKDCPDCNGSGWLTNDPNDGSCENPYCCDGVIWGNPLLEEYVDKLHFVLSIGNNLGFDLCLGEVIVTIKELDITTQFISLFRATTELYVVTDFEEYLNILGLFLGLGEMLGFTWEQIEQAYHNKHAINIERQNNGY